MSEVLEAGIRPEVDLPGAKRGAWSRKLQRLGDDFLRTLAPGYADEMIRDREWRAITEPLRPEQLYDPDKIIREWVGKVGGRGIIAYGEEHHHSTGVLDYESKLVRLLADFGLRAVFLEEDAAQSGHVKEFYRSGVMPVALERYLREGFVRQDSIPHNYKVALLQQCRRLSIPAVFIDRNKMPDRDRDWAGKIERYIGGKMDGLYLLIAGASHVYHVKMPNRLPRVVSLLDAVYKGMVLSVLSLGVDQNSTPTEQEILYHRLVYDLRGLGKGKKRVALQLKGSPYEGRLLRSASPVIASDAFDVVMAMPGLDMRR